MSEADRIRAEYARRSRDIPRDLYAYTAPENIIAGQELERLFIAALRRNGMLPLRDHDLLDVGCGTGVWLSRFEIWGARRERMAGIDLVADQAAEAQRKFPQADIREGDATRLPWADAAFDVAFQSMMFSSILDEDVQSDAAREMDRILRPGGVVLWYDFFVSAPGNEHTVGIGRRRIRSLFPGYDVQVRRATLAPPLGRSIAPRSRTLALALSGLRVLDTHFVGTLRKPG